MPVAVCNITPVLIQVKLKLEVNLLVKWSPITYHTEAQSRHLGLNFKKDCPNLHSQSPHWYAEQLSGYLPHPKAGCDFLIKGYINPGLK